MCGQLFKPGPREQSCGQARRPFLEKGIRSLTGRIPFRQKDPQTFSPEQLVAARKSFDFTQARESLLIWYGHVARKLPWRDPITPYRVWVSEIMLQQTTVSVVTGYFERFMARFPTVESLASAPESDLLKLWEGLGYYQRARNLHRAAGKIVAAGDFPRTRDEWHLLPGVGPSTAGAIASIAFGEREPILDANVRRVNRRLLHVMEPPEKRDILDQLWAISRGFVALPGRSPGETNQALMELGATVCRIRVPLCHECPLSGYCLTSTLSLDPNLPAIKKSPRKKVFRTALVGAPGDDLVLVVRSEGRFLEGLWDFPGEVLDGEPAFRGEGRILGRVSHVYTHIEEEVLVVEVPVPGKDYPNARSFFGIDEARSVPLTGAAKKILKILENGKKGDIRHV
jgi:A/G-specific adenine glycosylase